VKKILWTALALVALVTSAHAVQFKNNKDPAFKDLGFSLHARRIIDGLTQGENITISITATANPVVQCINPTNDKVFPPSSTPDPIGVSGFSRINKALISDEGRVLMNVATDAPPLNIEGAPDCAKHQTIEEITDLRFTQAHIVISQPPSTPVLTVTCTFNPPTNDGLVPPAEVSCVY